MIDYCVRCGRIVDEKYDQMCYDVHGVCLCKECRIWARAVTSSAKAPRSIGHFASHLERSPQRLRLHRIWHLLIGKGPPVSGGAWNDSKQMGSDEVRGYSAHLH